MKSLVVSLTLLLFPLAVYAQMSPQPTCEQQLRVLDAHYQSFQRSSYQTALEQQMRSDTQVKALEMKVKDLQKAVSEKLLDTPQSIEKHE